MGVQIPFSFLKSLDFKPLQTKVRVLPWQMNNTLIIVLIYSFLPGNALFCEGFREFCEMLRNDESGKSKQNLASFDYLLVVKLVVNRKVLLLRIFLLPFNHITNLPEAHINKFHLRI